MKKLKTWQKIIVLTLLMAIFVTVTFGSDLVFELRQVFYPIYANGYEVPQDDLPVLNYNGSTYVPLRKLSEAASVYVEWDDETKSVNIYNDYTEVSYLQKIVMAEQEADAVYNMVVTDIKVIFDYFFSYLDNTYTKQEALENINIFYDSAVQSNSLYQGVINSYLFPNGLNSDVVRENKLNNYLYNVNSAVALFEQFYNYTKGAINGIYTSDYAIDQLLILQKQIYDYSPSSYEQKYEIIKLIKDFGY